MNGDIMGRVFFFSPHPDDETLSMGLAILHYISNGYDVHLVSMTSGGALGVANTLNGSALGSPITCSAPADHPFIHSGAREGYDPHTEETVAAGRIAEARSALGMMAMVPPIAGVTPGAVYHHVGGLLDGFGSPDSGSSTAPVTRAGIDAAKAVMLPLIQDYPNSFHYTMSPADHHKDHAACGIALREIKAENPTLFGAPRFFVSRLYWASAQPDGHYQQDLLDEANGTLAWFTAAGTRTPVYADWLRNHVIKTYRAWNPAGGSYAMGYHSVAAQFEANFAPSVSVGNLWHA